MKRLFFIAIAVALFSHANAQAPGEKQKAHQAIINFFEGFSARDISIIKKHATADFLLLEDAMVWTTDTIANRFQQAKARGGSFTRANSFDFIKTEIKGQTAWVAYHNTAKISGDRPRTVKWLESAVLIKQGNDWKLQMMHSTPVRSEY